MWEVRLSNSRGVPYFFDTETQKSSWDAPPELTPEQISQLPGAAYLQSPNQVRASHLLVKHKDSRRPSSWKEPQITRSKEEAIEILRNHQATINGSPETFAAIASEHSDCSSHSQSGDLSWFKRGQMQKPFEDAAFALNVGEMSDIVSTDSGVHLIMRTG